jgi:uncharacterized membrane protein YedE/YeeE
VAAGVGGAARGPRCRSLTFLDALVARSHVALEPPRNNVLGIYSFVATATFFGTAIVATSTLGLWLLRRARARAVLTGEPVAWTRDLPGRPHVVGSVIFGVGWAVADACPGPIAPRSVRACCGASSRSPAWWPGSCSTSARALQPASAPAGST